MTSELDEFSASIAEDLYADFPEWRNYANVEETIDGSNYLVVDVPSPKEADTPDGLVISTYDGEITVFFDYYHSHFDRWRPVEPDDGYGSALEFVRSILNENVAVDSWWNGEKWLGSGQIFNGELHEFSTDFTHIRVRSWCGFYNKLSSTRVFGNSDGSL